MGKCDEGMRVVRQKRKRREGNYATLCFSCENADVIHCRWMADLMPVYGWKAKKTMVRGPYPGMAYSSYKVLRCPKYQPDTRRSRNEARTRKEGKK